MKSYRCVFNYAGGKTTIGVEAETAAQAVEDAQAAINAGDYDRVEIWDGETLLLTRATPRAWDAFGDALGDTLPSFHGHGDAAPEQPRTGPLTVSLPRRPPILFSQGLRALGFGAKKLRWQKRVGQ